jgi:AcrR family transcriptional regulator
VVISGAAGVAAGGDARRAPGRAALIEAAAAVIAQRGVRGLSVGAVAKRAGTTPALVYYHFGSSAGLVRAALHHANEQGPSVVLLPEHGRRSGRRAVVDALAAEFDDAPTVRNLNAIWNEVGALAVFDPGMRDDLREVTASWAATVAAGVRRGQDDGSVAADLHPDDAGELLSALVEGLSQRWLAGILTAAEARATLRTAVDAVLAPRD